MSTTESTQPFPLSKTNYLSKDYLTLRNELLAKLPLITKGRWTNLNESDPGIGMLETTISMVDTLMFYLDMQGQEMDLDRARQRSNVIRLLRLIGYETRGVSASQGLITLQVSPNESPFYPVYVSKGTQLSAQALTGSVIFTATENVNLFGPTDTKTIKVVQGVASTNTFISDGTPSQRFVLSSINIDRSLIEVFIDEDPSDTTQTISWNLVTSFYETVSDTKAFRTEIDEFNRVYIIFGDGQFGTVPSQGSLIYVNYYQTIGANGNVGKNSINKVISGVPFVQDKNQSKVNLVVLNSEATAGGSNIETIEAAKTTALGLLFGLNRALSRGDFEALMLSTPGVTKAIAWGENEEQNPDYRMLNRIRACFFSKDFSDMYYDTASRDSYRNLRDNQIRTLLTKKMPITSRLVFVDPVFVDIFVTLQVGINDIKYDPNIVLDQIRFNILDYFSLDNITFGQDIRISTLLSLSQNVPGVAWVKVTRLHMTPPDTGVDLAPNPPIDIILDKWKLPIFTDVTSFVPQTVTRPSPTYLQTVTPVSYFLGQNDIKIVNPDKQSDILMSGYTYYPGTNLQHITISYSAITDEPSPQGGYFGHPSQESDLTTYSSLE
jgi:hypothetical protein